MDEQISHADGDIQTVLGPIPAGELDPFLIHQHLLADLTPKGPLDFFGLESGFYPFEPVDMPNDAGRLAIIRGERREKKIK